MELFISYPLTVLGYDSNFYIIRETIGKYSIKNLIKGQHSVTDSAMFVNTVFRKFAKCLVINLRRLTKTKNLYSQINHTLQWYREVTYKNTAQHIHDK